MESFDVYRVHLYIKQRDSVQTIKQTLGEVFALLVGSGLNFKFCECIPKKLSYQESILYNFWALIHRPEKLAKECRWINDSAADNLPEREKQILQEIRDTTLKTYSACINGLIDAAVKHNSEEEDVDFSETEVLPVSDLDISAESNEDGASTQSEEMSCEFGSDSEDDASTQTLKQLS